MASSDALSETDFIRLFEEFGPYELSRRTNVSLRNIFRRRKVLERTKKIKILVPEKTRYIVAYRPSKEYSHRINLEIENGCVLVGSDFHYWPGPSTATHRAFVKFCKDLKPKIVVVNGDVLDAATISRHAPIGWGDKPALIQEIEAAQDGLSEIAKACPRGCQKVWTLGNHDSRFESRLAMVAPEFAQVHGANLEDHFPIWQMAWSCFINDHVVIKHRFKGGIHATHNNTLWAGKTMITGHLHSAQVRPFTDYNGTRFGVDSGCVADTDADAFVDYTEDSPKNWVSAFCVLTFVDGQLLWPELVTKWDDESVQFRGQLHKV